MDFTHLLHTVTFNQCIWLHILTFAMEYFVNEELFKYFYNLFNKYVFVSELLASALKKRWQDKERNSSGEYGRKFFFCIQHFLLCMHGKMISLRREFSTRELRKLFSLSLFLLFYHKFLSVVCMVFVNMCFRQIN